MLVKYPSQYRHTAHLVTRPNPFVQCAQQSILDMDRALPDNEVLTNAKLTAYGEILALGRRLKWESRVEILLLRRVGGRRSGSLRVHDMRML
jgi:hypothetical protein